MTDISRDIDMSPRIYGANELGVLSFTAPGPVHPRVEYVGGDLFIGLDAGAGGAAITQGQVEGWTLPFREAIDTAIDTAPAEYEVHGGMIVITDEVAGAAALLEPHRLSTASLAGAPVLFALARTMLVVVGADDDAAIGRALALAEQLYEAGGPLVSAHPIVLADGAWAPFRWREVHPALEMHFERVLRLFNVRAYEAQSVVLQRPDVHIADAKIRVLDSGVTTTFAAWPQGTATLLPVVDNVIIADPSGSLSVATMEQFLDAGGDAIVRTGLSPARYFVPGEAPRAERAEA